MIMRMILYINTVVSEKIMQNARSQNNFICIFWF